MAHLHMISQEAVNLLTNIVYKDVRNMWLSDDFITDSSTSKSLDHYDVDIKNICAAVVHPATGETITQYNKLAKDPAMRDVWQQAFGK